MENKITLYNNQIGKKIKFYRKKRGLTQSTLANMVGISAQQLQKYEVGKNKISASRIKLIAEILDVPLQYLFAEFGKNLSNSSNNILQEPNAKKLVYYYSLIKSEKLKNLLTQNAATYVEGGL